MGFFDALFGGGGSSSTSSTTTTSNTTNATDRRMVADGSALVATEGSHINTSDLGAVEKAAALGQAAIVGATQVATSSNAQAQATLVKALDVTGNAMAQIEKAYANAQDSASGNRTLIAGGIVLAGLALLSKVGRKK